MHRIQPDYVSSIDETIRRSLTLGPDVALGGVSADYLESHWLAVLEAIWLIEAAHGVDVPLNDNLPAQNIRSAADLKALCVSTVATSAA